MFCYEPAAWEWSQLLSLRVPLGAFCGMREKVTTITDEIGKLIDRQNRTVEQAPLPRPNSRRSGWLPETEGPYPPTVLVIPEIHRPARPVTFHVLPARVCFIAQTRF